MANGPWMIKHQNLLNLYTRPLLIEHRTCTTAKFTVYLCVRIDLAQNNISVSVCAIEHVPLKPYTQPTFVHIHICDQCIEFQNPVFLFPLKVFFFLFSSSPSFTSFNPWWVCICRLSNSCYSLMVMLPMSFLLPLLSCSLSDAYRFGSFIAVAVAVAIVVVISFVHYSLIFDSFLCFGFDKLNALEYM